MTPQQNIATAPRQSDADDAEFAFFYGTSATRFYPGRGARLSFASRGVDTLTLPGLPPGLLSAGVTVTVARYGTTVFKGTVDKVAQTWSGGAETFNTATVVGPWSSMLRKVFRQAWTVSDLDGGTTTMSTAHCILNQGVDGSPQSMRATAAEILDAGSGCGYAVETASCSALPNNLALPFDEVRNITVADALNRLLRFHPRYVVRFDYAASTPKIKISDVDAAATGIEEGNVLGRETNTIAHPIVGVDIATEDIDAASVVDPDTGAVKPMRAITHQTAGDTSSIDCLHVFMPLQPASATTSWESLRVEAESIPDGTNLTALRNWWISKHPRLKDVTAAEITTISQQRSGTKGFDQITSCTEDALTAFGLDAETVRFTATVTITKSDDIEEKLVLTMDFVTTDAHAGKHTRQTGSSALAAETLPSGLAQAILDQRGGALESEDVTVRLGDEFPVVGSEYDDLVLQNFDVDLDDCTATLHFGHPDYLTPEDMRDLLNGFRARGYASNAPSRGTGEVAEDAPEAVGGILPFNTTEFQPGSKKKTVVKDANNANAGKILLDSTQVGTGATMEVKTFTIGSGTGAQTVKVLATANATIPTGGGGGGTSGETGSHNFLTGLDIANTGSSASPVWQLRISYKVGTFADGLLSSVAGTESHIYIPLTLHSAISGGQGYS